MIPFRHTDERVWRAIRDLQGRGVDLDGWTVHLDPVLVLEADHVLRPAFGAEFPARLFGLPVVPDGRLRRGEIVLLREVSA